MKKWREISFLVVIVLLSAAFRLYRLGSVPPGLTNDEADTAYDAYSILRTGRDQWGEFLPVTSFRGFGDNRLPIYTYAVVPSVSIFGLTPFAVRLPSALFGTLTVIVFYLFLMYIFRNRLISLIGAVLLAINPWHIAVSRVGLESNLAALLILSGIYFLYLAVRKPVLYLPAFIAMGLSLLTYTTSIMLVPVLTLTFFLLYREAFRQALKPVAAGLLGLAILTGILLRSGSNSGTRLGQVSFTNDPGIVNGINERRGACTGRLPVPVCQLVFNKVPFYALKLATNYISHFSPQLLVIDGTETQYSILPKRGLYYFTMIPLLLMGTYAVLREKYRGKVFVMVWLMAAAVPDTLTGTGHYSRYFISIVPFIILAAYGCRSLFRGNLRWMAYLLGILMALEVILFTVEYYTYFPVYYSRFSNQTVCTIQNNTYITRFIPDSIP